jgi:hypothetical protein
MPSEGATVWSEDEAVAEAAALLAAARKGVQTVIMNDGEEIRVGIERRQGDPEQGRGFLARGGPGLGSD